MLIKYGNGDFVCCLFGFVTCCCLRCWFAAGLKDTWCLRYVGCVGLLLYLFTNCVVWLSVVLLVCLCIVCWKCFVYCATCLIVLRFFSLLVCCGRFYSVLHLIVVFRVWVVSYCLLCLLFVFCLLFGFCLDCCFDLGICCCLL